MTALAKTGAVPRPGQVTLVDRGQTVLSAFSHRSHKYAHKRLTHEGAVLRLETGVKAVHAHGVDLTDGTTLHTPTVVWGGGESAAPVVTGSGLATGRGGRLEVEPDLTLPGHPQAYAVGDVANIPAAGGGTLPQLGSVAQQSGRWAADNILRGLRGQERAPFQYKDKGIMAMIGRNAAVAEVGRHRHQVEGPVAFAAWLGVHAMLLSGAHSKTNAFLSWGWDYFDRDHAAIVEGSSTPKRIAWGDEDSDKPTIRVEPASRPPPEPTHLRSPTMDDHYDVIIVGSGAGGHARSSARALGKAPAHPRARRLAASRAGELDAEAVFVDNRYVSPDRWYDGDGKAFQPQVHYNVGGATKFYGAALYALRERISASSSTTTAFLPPGPSATTSWSRTTRRRRSCTRSTVLVGRTRPSRQPRPYPFPPVSHEPRIQKLFDDMVAVGLHPFHSPCGVLLDEVTRRSAPASAARRVTGPPVSCTPRRTRRSCGSSRDPARQRHPGPQRAGPPARDRRIRRTVTSVVADVEGHEQWFSADLVVLSAGAVRLRQDTARQPNDRHPNSWPTARARWDETTCSTTAGVLAVSTKNIPGSEELGLNDEYFGDADFGDPMGNVQMVGKSSAPMYRGEKPIETKLSSTFALRDVAEHAVDFWLSVEDCPTRTTG